MWATLAARRLQCYLPWKLHRQAPTLSPKGRAKGSSAGTGVLTANGSDTDITFAGSDWSECKATVNLNKGINDVEISRGSGNGLFYIDYIELK